MQCPHCEKRFATHDGLSRHVVAKHGKAWPLPPPTPEEMWALIVQHYSKPENWPAIGAAVDTAMTVEAAARKKE